MLRQVSILFALLVFALYPSVATAGPIAGPDGVLRYPFGERTPPTLQCKPLFVCDIVLEPGESIVNVAVGDSTGVVDGFQLSTSSARRAVARDPGLSRLRHTPVAKSHHARFARHRAVPSDLLALRRVRGVPGRRRGPTGVRQGNVASTGGATRGLGDRSICRRDVGSIWALSQGCPILRRSRSMKCVRTWIIAR
jgi:hypothetical protein